MVLVLVVYGCATAPPKPTPEKIPEKVPEKAPEKVSLPPFPQRYLDLAEGYERTGELRRALLCWEVLQSLQPGNGEAAKKIADLKARTSILADQHFKQGLIYHKNNSVPAARREFSLALYYNPEHAEALTYLKVKLNEEDCTYYEVKPGDTLREIARKIYNDPQKDFLIAYINHLGKDPKLVPKTVLLLPILDASQVKAVVETTEMPMDPKEILAEPKDSKEAVEPQDSKEVKETKEGRETREMMAKAEIQFKTNKFKETAIITEDILSIDPTNKQARDLKNASYYQMGKMLSTQKKYQEALDQLARVEPGFRDVSDLVVVAKRQLAEVHYVKGIKYYTEEKLDQAVQEWEVTLKLNPQHPKAKGDMDNALKLLQRLKEIK
jgi:tetratricopeptide (TPR) repeat protein